jgi:hypothetical protein
MSDTASVFQRVLGGSFERLPPLVQHVHDARPTKKLVGRADVERGSHWLVSVLAPIASLPPTAKDISLTVSIDAGDSTETWSRNFSGHVMRSRLWAKGDLLAERLGPITLLFALSVDQARLEWRVAGARYLGVPLPSGWFAGASASEQVVDGRYTFDVRATLPLVGLLVRYRGWLAEHDRL